MLYCLKVRSLLTHFCGNIALPALGIFVPKFQKLKDEGF